MNTLFSYEREEAFYALNLALHPGGLAESLRQFVKGEYLEGDNAYYCERCGTNVSIISIIDYYYYWSYYWDYFEHDLGLIDYSAI